MELIKLPADWSVNRRGRFSHQEQEKRCLWRFLGGSGGDRSKNSRDVDQLRGSRSPPKLTQEQHAAPSSPGSREDPRCPFKPSCEDNPKPDQASPGSPANTEDRTKTSSTHTAPNMEKQGMFPKPPQEARLTPDTPKPDKDIPGRRTKSRTP